MYIYIRMKISKGKSPQTATITVTLPILSGSLSTARSTCGKPQCACHQDPAKRHGVYYRWTGLLNGKRTTKTLSPEEALACQGLIQNYRALQRTIDALLQQSLAQAPWTHREGKQAPHSLLSLLWPVAKLKLAPPRPTAQPKPPAARVLIRRCPTR